MTKPTSYERNGGYGNIDQQVDYVEKGFCGRLVKNIGDKLWNERSDLGKFAVVAGAVLLVLGISLAITYGIVGQENFISGANTALDFIKANAASFEIAGGAVGGTIFGVALTLGIQKLRQEKPGYDPVEN